MVVTLRTDVKITLDIPRKRYIATGRALTPESVRNHSLRGAPFFFFVRPNQPPRAIGVLGFLPQIRSGRKSVCGRGNNSLRRNLSAVVSVLRRQARPRRLIVVKLTELRRTLQRMSLPEWRKEIDQVDEQVLTC